MTLTRTDDPLRDALALEVEYSKDSLLKKAHQLQNHVGSIAKRFETQADPTINELGELQNLATIFEATCGRYGAARQSLRIYDGFKADESTGNGGAS